VLDPNHRDSVAPRPFDQAADVRDDRIAIVSARDDALLDIDDEECCVRAVL
jgi:hypothetical protein